MAQASIRQLLLVLALAPSLAACDRLRFEVRNDTARPVRVDFKFAQVQSTCRTPGFFADSVDLAAGHHFPFVCPPSEVVSISITQGARRCTLRRDQLAKLGGALTASRCLSGRSVGGR